MDYMSEYKRWLDCSALSADEHAELAAVADNQEEIESRFFAPLSFGTAGLRGVLGVGLNRMNRFTVGQAAQGLANLIVSNGQARNGPRRCHRIRLPPFLGRVRQAVCVHHGRKRHPVAAVR